MQNWVLFQTVTDSSEELVFKGKEKMKNSEIFVHAVEVSFWEN